MFSSSLLLLTDITWTVTQSFSPGDPLRDRLSNTNTLRERKLYGRDFSTNTWKRNQQLQGEKKKIVKNIIMIRGTFAKKSVWKLSYIILGRESPCNLLKQRSCPSYTIQAVGTSQNSHQDYILRKFKNIKRKHHFYGKRPFLIPLITF